MSNHLCSVRHSDMVVLDCPRVNMARNVEICSRQQVEPVEDLSRGEDGRGWCWGGFRGTFAPRPPVRLQQPQPRGHPKSPDPAPGLLKTCHRPQASPHCQALLYAKEQLHPLHLRSKNLPKTPRPNRLASFCYLCYWIRATQYAKNRFSQHCQPYPTSTQKKGLAAPASSGPTKPELVKQFPPVKLKLDEPSTPKTDQSNVVKQENKSTPKLNSPTAPKSEQPSTQKPQVVTAKKDPLDTPQANQTQSPAPSAQEDWAESEKHSPGEAGSATTATIKPAPNPASPEPSKPRRVPTWGRRPLSADLTSKFEPPSRQEPPRRPVVAPAKVQEVGQPAEVMPKEQMNCPETVEETFQKTDEEEKERPVQLRGGSIKKRISQLFDSASSNSSSTRAHPPEEESPSTEQPNAETDVKVGVKERMKAFTSESPLTPTSAPKPAFKPRPLSQDLTKCFSGEKEPSNLKVLDKEGNRVHPEKTRETHGKEEKKDDKEEDDIQAEAVEEGIGKEVPGDREAEPDQEVQTKHKVDEGSKVASRLSEDIRHDNLSMGGADKVGGTNGLDEGIRYDDFSVKPRRWGTLSRTPWVPRETHKSWEEQEKKEEENKREERETGREKAAGTPHDCQELLQEEMEEDSREEPFVEKEPERRADDRLTPVAPSVGDLIDLSGFEPVPEPASPSSLDPEDIIDPTVSLEPEPLPLPEFSTSLLDSSAQLARANLGRMRNRNRPSMAARSASNSSTLSNLQEAAGEPDWRFRDSTVKSRCNSSSEPEPGPSSSQPPRVAVFPGMDTSVLKAAIQKRGGDSDGLADRRAESPTPSPLDLLRRAPQITHISPSQLSVPTPSSPQSQRPPKSPLLPGAARVLPPAAGAEDKVESTPSWLQELKSKKRFNQPGSDS
ncbi:hypothetical protein GJAV_G00040060 [Gymnothorax javanicus]|nr:hypothetical protein GJAV_G00040060 [Gymnothorax javanicus]